MKEQHTAKPMGVGSIALIKQPVSANPLDQLRMLSNSGDECYNDEIQVENESARCTQKLCMYAVVEKPVCSKHKSH